MSDKPILPKVWQHRSCTPEDTLAAIAPFFRQMGITRVADVTGLDNIGIPVVQAIRPMGRSLSVSQGKGLTLAAASVSAAMESAEGWHAENLALAERRDTIENLRQAFDLDGLSVSAHLPRDVPLDFVSGTDLTTGDEIWVPVELVSKDFTRHSALPQFVRTTNGLASGNTKAEAIASALHEVIERDCLADYAEMSAEQRRSKLRSTAWFSSLGSDVDWLLTCIEQAGMKIYVSDITNDLGVSCVRAQLIDVSGQGKTPCAQPAYGSGCHLDPKIATIRAITEAAQSRLTIIAGSRDDLTLENYIPAMDGNVVCAVNAAMDIAGLNPQQSAPETLATNSAEGDVDALLSAFSKAGLPQVGIVDLSQDAMPIHVVRAVVPGLGFPMHPKYRRGQRHKVAVE